VGRIFAPARREKTGSGRLLQLEQMASRYKCTAAAIKTAGLTLFQVRTAVPVPLRVKSTACVERERCHLKLGSRNPAGTHFAVNRSRDPSCV
jgi:hypothetical protein